MGAFDSVKMGHRCKGWSLAESDAPERVFTRGTSVGGEKWIVNAAGGGRRRDVLTRSAVVLDGGPRWVLSTALGFLTGGLWWTFVYTALFAVINYVMFVNSANAPWKSDAEAAMTIAYTILATVLSIASVPGSSWSLSEWKGVAPGLIVEMFLCFCVIISAGILHNFFGPSLVEFPGLSPYADSGRWAVPALLWVAASSQREKAIEAVRMKMSGWWRYHPMLDVTQPSSPQVNASWDDWSATVEECANRVGGYGMLGFSTLDLDILSASSPTPKASEAIKHLRSGLHEDGSTVEPWIKQSSALLAGYDCRLRVGKPERSKSFIQLHDVGQLIRSMISDGHPEIDSYKKEIEERDKQRNYMVRTEDGVDRWFFAGALLADSDVRTGSASSVQTYGSRLAVSIALLIEGTDPLARLACYADIKIQGSSVSLLQSAITKSVEALVVELARGAGVQIDANVPMNRGLAYATETGGSTCLAYSPDELVAASHLEETIVISNKTFSGVPRDDFETLWRGSAEVEKRVDVSDMVPLADAPSEAGDSACRGWMIHLGFTLAVLTLYLLDASSSAIVVILLVAIPAKNKRVSMHSSNHFYMIYIRFILNYARCVSRWASLSQRGRATVKKANNSREIVFFFVNVLPVLACYVLRGTKWWAAFIPCILANIPGLLNTVVYGWASAFKYEWWSWHVPNRWFSGHGYLEVVALRNRVGRNVLLLNDGSRVMSVQHVKPSRGSVPKDTRFVVVGGGR